MKNLKTTIIGIAAAIAYLALAWVLHHAITPDEIALAGGIAGIGLAAKDAGEDIKAIASEVGQLPALQNNVVKTVLPLADDAITLADASHPTNVLLGDIKTGIDALNASVAAGPAAAPAGK